MCPHDDVTINCTTYTGNLLWISPNDIATPSVYYAVFSTKLPYTLGTFNITGATSNGDIRSSIVTLYNVMIGQNNTGIECLDGIFGNENTKTVSAAIIISGILGCTLTLIVFMLR